MKYQRENTSLRKERDVDLETGETEDWNGLFEITYTIELNNGKFKYYDHWKPSSSRGRNNRISYSGTYEKKNDEIILYVVKSEEFGRIKFLDDNKIMFEGKEYKKV